MINDPSSPLRMKGVEICSSFVFAQGEEWGEICSG